MIGFKPQKGKAFENLPQKTLKIFDHTKYLVSTKYDGNQIFVVKSGDSIRCFTSDWKEFSNYIIEEPLLNITADFTLVGEFMFDCEGKLGDRVNSAILTTLRTNFNKGLSNSSVNLARIQVRFFDILSPVLITQSYELRLQYLSDILHSVDCANLQAITAKLMTGIEATEHAKYLVNQGYEGAMLVEPDSKYLVGKRVNHSIKLKYRKTADLLCIDTEEGTGKYEGLLGSLVLQDSAGRLVSVGSGLDDMDRQRVGDEFIGTVIEISYEQIMDTYIQPTYIGVRADKKVEDID